MPNGVEPGSPSAFYEALDFNLFSILCPHLVGEREGVQEDSLSLLEGLRDPTPM